VTHQVTHERVTIEPRFNGPPGSGNGGFTCGLLGTRLPNPVEVTLRKPPPLGRPLLLEGDGQQLKLLDGDLLIAEARSTPLELEVPAPPSFDRAQALSALYAGLYEHNFPGCFTCGPARAPGDGLRVFAGRERPDEPVTAVWVPHSSVGDADGLVRPEICWAAIDCPGYFGAAPADHPAAVLGRMTGEITGRVRVGERCVVLGWSLGSEGRKLFAGTALFGDDGRRIGRARQTWFRI
jgi:hypothetical protein